MAGGAGGTAAGGAAAGGASAGGASAGGDDSSPRLLTQAPGYVLRTDSSQIDLFQFYARLEAGRAELAAGSPQVAARTLRSALDLWRGALLADLVEAGVTWPELTSAKGVRMDAMEDYFEAELASGRHHAIICDLEAMVENEVLRERSCAQLMLALYRSGRQADALSVYVRVRSALVEELGLEPSRALQDLQQRILTHDPSLATPGVALPGEAWRTWSPAGERGAERMRSHAAERNAEQSGDRPGAAERTDRSGPDVRTPAPRPMADLPEHQPAVAPVRPVAPVLPVAPILPFNSPKDSRTSGPSGESGPQSQSSGGGAERKQVSVVLICTRFSPGVISEAGRGVDELLVDAFNRVKAEIELFGGNVAASIGPVTMALFGARGTAWDDAERAVRAALSIRDSFARSADDPAAPGPDTRVAIATGEALVLTRPGADGLTISVTGTLLEECQVLLERVPERQVLVSDSTRDAACGLFVYDRAEGAAGGWRVEDIGSPPAVSDRECELGLLQSVFRRTHSRRTPQLVTVLGEEGSGKTRFVTEFANRISAQMGRTRCLVASARSVERGSVTAIQAEMLSEYCGILPDDSADMVRRGVTDAVDSLPFARERVDRMRSRLISLLARGAVGDGADESSRSWIEFMEGVAHIQPLVLVFENLHDAEDPILDLVEGLSESVGSVPLLVMATACPDLLRRRPDWGGGQRHVTAVSLDRVRGGVPDWPNTYLLPVTDTTHRPRQPGRGGPFITTATALG
ncbi:BTAD domain-containing putative transcriptional regulator [Streptomyces sp. GMY02]|uniref:BTAD domain-containing putative transcriptional regulator n=1 Tax=Streptomyces sp. GMY02 TaxID=1333528 RepID=UPI0020B84D24|nr:BTAD domain-containing putative transcriptional regulator [Streptomyces sp. GMY02]